MGWWIRDDSTQYEIPDHYTFILENPKLFGFSAKEAKGWTLADRNRVIKNATQKGWIRVRGRSPHLSMEFWRPDSTTLANIKDFLIAHGVDPDQKIMFEENVGEGSWYEPASWVLSDQALVLSGKKRK